MRSSAWHRPPPHRACGRLRRTRAQPDNWPGSASIGLHRHTAENGRRYFGGRRCRVLRQSSPARCRHPYRRSLRRSDQPPRTIPRESTHFGRIVDVQKAWVSIRRPSSVRRLHGHHNSRRTNKCGEVFSARRNFRIRCMRWLAEHHGPGAYCGATWRFSSWELPSFYSLKRPKNRRSPHKFALGVLAICPEGRYLNQNLGRPAS